MKSLLVDTNTYIMKGEFLMKSFCIKTNNKNIINYLLEKLSTINSNDIYISNNHFKIYENIIVHYLGDDTSYFLNVLCDILSNTILNFYEKAKLKEIININYFYFSDAEKKQILNICINSINNDDTVESYIRKEHIYISLLKYINNNKSFILDGFVNFRLSEYMKILDYTVDTSVNSFLIEREYFEFINLLKLYISSKNSQTDIVHLIYINNESILIDDNKNIISTKDNIFNAKYLSDISFSSNDYCLNTLLTLLPERIIIHLIDSEDEFINTLKLIFEKRVLICSGCSICTAYKMSNHIK